ncbi:unnamed protein product [Ambrosiozyma monospora]|uniref:Unnamed protein product n=1 Tax=Ambrosiozyma monospora TaxID=43982 RepID=A0A9W7DFV9_AMBMO|nr:unnamed protein product [Ambrosiozyma monospora]
MPSIPEINRNCKACDLPIEIGSEAFELSGDAYHSKCFKCSKCMKQLGQHSKFLVLGTGALVCADCSYSCKACGKKIYDMAIITGDMAYCAECFKCKACKKAIEDLRYARTSKGLFCMPCHNRLMEKKKRYDEMKQQRLAKQQQQQQLSKQESQQSQHQHLPRTHDHDHGHDHDHDHNYEHTHQLESKQQQAPPPLPQKSQQSTPRIRSSSASPTPVLRQDSKNKGSSPYPNQIRQGSVNRRSSGTSEIFQNVDAENLNLSSSTIMTNSKPTERISVSEPTVVSVSPGRDRRDLSSSNSPHSHSTSPSLTPSQRFQRQFNMEPQQLQKPKSYEKSVLDPRSSKLSPHLNTSVEKKNDANENEGEGEGEYYNIPIRSPKRSNVEFFDPEPQLEQDEFKSPFPPDYFNSGKFGQKQQQQQQKQKPQQSESQQSHDGKLPPLPSPPPFHTTTNAFDDDSSKPVLSKATTPVLNSSAIDASAAIKSPSRKPPAANIPSTPDHSVDSAIIDMGLGLSSSADANANNNNNADTSTSTVIVGGNVDKSGATAPSTAPGSSDSPDLRCRKLSLSDERLSAEYKRRNVPFKFGSAPSSPEDLKKTMLMNSPVANTVDSPSNKHHQKKSSGGLGRSISRVFTKHKRVTSGSATSSNSVQQQLQQQRANTSLDLGNSNNYSHDVIIGGLSRSASLMHKRSISDQSSIAGVNATASYQTPPLPMTPSFIHNRSRSEQASAAGGPSSAASKRHSSSTLPDSEALSLSRLKETERDVKVAQADLANIASKKLNMMKEIQLLEARKKALNNEIDTKEQKLKELNALLEVRHGKLDLDSLESLLGPAALIGDGIDSTGSTPPGSRQVSSSNVGGNGGKGRLPLINNSASSTSLAQTYSHKNNSRIASLDELPEHQQQQHSNSSHYSRGNGIMNGPSSRNGSTTSLNTPPLPPNSSSSGTTGSNFTASSPNENYNKNNHDLKNSSDKPRKGFFSRGLFRSNNAKSNGSNGKEGIPSSTGNGMSNSNSLQTISAPMHPRQGDEALLSMAHPPSMNGGSGSSSDENGNHNRDGAGASNAAYGNSKYSVVPVTTSNNNGVLDESTSGNGGGLSNFISRSRSTNFMAMRSASGSMLASSVPGGNTQNSSISTTNGSGANGDQHIPGGSGIQLYRSTLQERASLENRGVPFIVTCCVREIEIRGLTVEGIYRASGSTQVIDKLENLFDCLEFNYGNSQAGDGGDHGLLNPAHHNNNGNGNGKFGATGVC